MFISIHFSFGRVKCGRLVWLIELVHNNTFYRKKQLLNVFYKYLSSIVNKKLYYKNNYTNMQAPYRSKEIQCHGKLSFVVVVKCNIERKNKIRTLLDYEVKKKKEKMK